MKFLNCEDRKAFPIQNRFAHFFLMNTRKDHYFSGMRSGPKRCLLTWALLHIMPVFVAQHNCIAAQKSLAPTTYNQSVIFWYNILEHGLGLDDSYHQVLLCSERVSFPITFKTFKILQAIFLTPITEVFPFAYAQGFSQRAGNYLKRTNQILVFILRYQDQHALMVYTRKSP